MISLDPASLEVRDRYALLIGLIQPRPIAWVSTISPDGKTNLAPFSFFTGICANPMTLCFAPVNDRHGRRKDTLLNVEATKEFVVNIATESNAAQMNQSSAPYPYGVSEFEKTGATPVPSTLVKPPRVKESPAAYECRLLQIVPLGEGPLAGNLIIGQVVQIHVSEQIYKGGKISHSDLKTIGRMEGAWYSKTQDAFELPRPEAA